MIQAKGKSSLYLICNVIARIIGLILLFVTLQYGVFWVILSQVITMLIQYLIVAIPNGKLYGYTIGKQFLDLAPYIALTTVMGGVVYLFNFLTIHPYLILVLQVLSGVVIYVLASIIFKLPAFSYLLNTIKSLFSKNKKTPTTEEIKEN